MDFVDIIIEYLPIFMFLTMGVLLFIGYPVGFILGGVAITYGFIGYLFGVFKIAEFFNFVPRMWGFSAENLILVAIPSFVFYRYFMRKVDSLILNLEQESSKLVDALHSDRQVEMK